MSGYLIDTNVISEFSNPVPDAEVVRWFRMTPTDEFYASVVTFGEIRIGIENLPEGKRRTELEVWFEGGLPAWFAYKLLPVTKRIANKWGILTIQAKRRGMSLSTTDGLIAATALEHGLTLVTRNVKISMGLG